MEGNKTGNKKGKRPALEEDKHVGARVRFARGLADMTQGELAFLIGVTFQQLQKYENGVNRVSVGRLWRIAAALNQPVEFFYKGLSKPGSRRRVKRGAVSEADVDALIRAIRPVPEGMRSSFIRMFRFKADAAAHLTA